MWPKANDVWSGNPNPPPAPPDKGGDLHPYTDSSSGMHVPWQSFVRSIKTGRNPGTHLAAGLTHVRLMFEQRSLKIDLCALALLAIVAFLGVAMGTYNA